MKMNYALSPQSPPSPDFYCQGEEGLGGEGHKK